MAGVCDVGMSELVCGVAYLAAWQKTIRGTEVVEKRRTVRAKCHQITPKLSQNEDKYAAKKYTLSLSYYCGSKRGDGNGTFNSSSRHQEHHHAPRFIIVSCALYSKITSQVSRYRYLVKSRIRFPSPKFRVTAT